MSALRAGALVAVVVAGPPLWMMVQSDQLDSAAALERWGAVAAVCSLLASGIAALVRSYESQTTERRRAEVLAEAEAAVERAGTAGDTGSAQQPSRAAS